jgi:Schlafen, AlbA_2
MIPKKLDDITEADLDGLVANSVPEGRTIDYKKSLPSNADADKKEFLADVSSFANTTGGDLIFGVDEAQGVPTGIPGLTIPDPDLEVRRLDSIIGDGLEPRIKVAIRVVNRNGALPVLMVRAERSWIGPHRVIFKGHDKFYARNSAGKYPMGVSELRSAFNLTDTVTERVRAFRAARIAILHGNRTPVPLTPGQGRTALHCIPLASLAGQPVNYDVLKFTNQPAKLPPLVTGGGWNPRINLDGLVTYSGGQEGALSYTQLFRNGTVEAVEAYWLNVSVGHGGTRTIPYAAVERDLMEYLRRSFEIQKELGVNPPIVVALSLIGTRGLTMASDAFSYNRGYAITEDDLILPESMVESFDEPPGKILKPIFDLIWNACGFAKSKNFDDRGNWVQQR